MSSSNKKDIAKKINLQTVDSLFFGIDETTIKDIPLSSLHNFPNHPFKVNDDEKMEELVESITKYGVLVPIIVKQISYENYQVISGHRRKHASELAGKTTIPAIIKDIDDDTATIFMVDSNLQREKLLFSEKAFAYKMKLEALKHQGSRSDLTLDQVGLKLKNSIETLSEQTGESKTQIKRLIRLTELIPELLTMTDNEEIAFNTAYELSYLEKEEQTLLFDIMEKEQIKPSLSDARKLKNCSQEKGLAEKDMIEILLKEEKQEDLKITIQGNKLKKYFPKDYTQKQIEDTIIGLLESWHNKQKN